MSPPNKERVAQRSEVSLPIAGSQPSGSVAGRAIQTHASFYPGQQAFHHRTAWWGRIKDLLY